MAVKPKLALIPSGVKANKVYSVLPADGVGDFDFSRSGSATRVNKDGLIETVDSNVPRLNYPMIDGVVSGCPSHILEPQRTNLVQYSEAFDNSYWDKSSLSLINNATISPDGELNAFKLVEDTASITHQVQKFFSFSNQKYSLSVFLKKADKRNWIKINLYDGSSSVYAYFDLTNGVIGQELGAIGKIENYGNGWYRCSMSTASNVSSGNGNISFRLAEFDGGTGYTGDGTSGLYIYGAQFEEGSYPTSYIKTTTSAVTRSAETANGSGDASTFSDSQGVLMAEISALDNDGTSRQISISNGGTTERVYFGFRANANEFILSSRDSSYLIANISDVTNFNKYAFQYKSGSFKAFINGFDYDLTLDGGLLPTGLNTLNFDSGAGDQNFYGNTKQIQYFDTALNDTDLETLTSWVSFTDMANSQLYSIQ